MYKAFYNIPFKERVIKICKMIPHSKVTNYGTVATRCPDHIKPEQKQFLEQEGIEVSDTFMVDLDKYGWFG